MTKVAFKKWYKNGWASPLAGLIAIWTWGKYSHVELMVETEGTNHYPIVQGFSASAWDNEVRLKVIDFNNGKWDIIETSREIDMEYIASVLDDPYDYLAIALCEFIPLELEAKDRSYCSETVSCALGLEECQNDPVKLYKFLVRESLEYRVATEAFAKHEMEDKSRQLNCINFLKEEK